MRRTPKFLELNALSITLFYLIFALLWILLSDQFLIWITDDPLLISRYQTLKGIFYVLATAGFLYYLIDLSNTRITNEKKRIDKALAATQTAIWYFNVETERLSYSNHFHKLFGFEKKPAKSSLKKYHDLIHPDDLEHVQDELDRVVNREQPMFNVDFRVNWPDGSLHWLRSHGTLLPDEVNKTPIVTGVLKDVTRQKELEEKYAREKELFESIFQNIPIMIDVNTENLESIRVNKAYEEITGWSQEEIQDKNIMKKVYPDPETRKKAQKVIDEANGEWHEFETYNKQGEKRIQQWANIRLSGGNTVGIGLDITEQKELEEQVAREKELFERIFEQIPVIVDIYDPELNEIRVNKAFQETLGWSNQEVENIDLMKACYPDPEMRSKALQVMSEADGKWHTFQVQDKWGNRHIQEWSNIQLSDNSIIGIGLDVTELKSKQKEIIESRKLLQKTFESLKEAVLIIDPKSRVITDCNKSTTELFGYTKEELIGNSTKMLHINEEKYHEFDQLGTKDLEEKGFFQTKFSLQKKDGAKFYSEHTVSLVKNEDGSIEKVVSVIQDITDTVEYQEQLKKLAQRYRRAEEIASFGHWRRNIKTDEAVWSQGFYNAIGLKLGERDTSFESLLDMIHPDDRELYEESFKEALETGSLNVRYRIIKPASGEVGYYHELAQTEYDEEGNPEFISGTIQDMTEREEFQLKLKQRNDFIETTLENLPIGVAVNLIDSGEATLMNAKFSEIYGWPKEVLNNVETFFEKVFPDENYRRKITDMIRADLASQDPERMEWKGIKITTKSGEKRIINAKNIPVYDQNLMISTVVDVTAQAEAEAKLAESEHNYRLLFQKSPQPMWIFNPEDYSFVEVNNAAVKHYGYTRKEFQEMTILDIRPENDQEEVKKSVENLKVEKMNDNREWRHIKKNGELIYVTITGSDIDYFGNQYRLILVNDITQQKKAEEMVLASLVEGENKERARIARELHDGLGQYLAAANMNFDAVQTDIEKLEERRQEQFKKGLNLLKHAVTETAQISRNLLPRVVDDYGLALAIEALIANYSSNTNIEISYYHNIDGLDLPRKVELNLYRITQEGLSNAIKYSEASKINVQLIKDELDLILSIDDNGKGFDLSDSDFKPGLGLQTIKTRTGALGGELELDSRPGKGTYLHIIVPIEKNS